MDIVWLLISLAVHFFMTFVLMYCCDSAEIWKDGRAIQIHKPSIYNLKNLDDKHDVNKYIEDVIKPSHHYSVLKKKISETDGGIDSGTGCLISMVLQGFSFLLILKNALKVFPMGKLPQALYYIIVVIICVAICGLGYYIIKKLYNKHLAIEEFRYNREDLERTFVYDDTEFDISEEDAFNNYVLMCHYRYLSSIEDTVVFRKNILKVMSWVSTIIYILFFMRTSD